MNNKPDFSSQESEIINTKVFFFRCLKKWYWFVVSFLFFLSLFLCFLFFSNSVAEQYVATTSLLIQKEKQPQPTEEDFLAQVGGISNIKSVEDDIEVLKSLPFMLEVVKDLDLETEYYIKNRNSKYVELYENSPLKLFVSKTSEWEQSTLFTIYIKAIKQGYEVEVKSASFKEKYNIKEITESIKTPFGILSFEEIRPIEKDKQYMIVRHPNNQSVANLYLEGVNVSLESSNPNVLQVSLQSNSAQKSIKILNKIIKLYKEVEANEKKELAEKADLFFKERIDLLEVELNSIESSIENYKRENNFTNVELETEAFLKSLAEYNKELSSVDIQISLLEYIESYVKASKNEYELIPSNLGIKEEALVLLIEEYNNLLLKRFLMLVRSNNEKANLEQVESDLLTLRLKVISSITTIKEGLNIKKTNISKKRDYSATQLKKLSTHEREFLEKKRVQKVKQDIYLYLLKKQQENEIYSGTTGSVITMLNEGAVTVLEKQRKAKPILLLLTFILAALVPAVVLFLLDVFKDVILEKEECTNRIKAPFLGVIGKLKKREDLLLGKNESDSPAMEMFRFLRVNLQALLSNDKKSHVVLVTSSIRGEGRSFVAANLALSLAIANKKVVLVELDLRNPTLNKHLGSPRDKKGVTEFLSNSDVELKDIIRKSSIDANLSFIQAGFMTSNPTEVLMSSRLDEMISELRKSYEYIILDSAPFGIVADTLELSRVVDNTICVARQNYTPKSYLADIEKIYEEDRLKNLSLVLNEFEDFEIPFLKRNKGYRSL